MKKCNFHLLNFLTAISLILVSCSTQDEKKHEEKTIESAKHKTPSKLDGVATRHPELTTFVYLVNLAELEEVFDGTGPFTVFAPSNAAFEKLGKEKLEQLQKPENRDELTSLLIYHVVPGKYLAQHLKTMDAPTVNGKRLGIIVNGNDDLKIRDAKIIQRDLVGPNGVIHIIDLVLLPN